MLFSRIAGVAMKKIPKAQEILSFPNLPDTYKAKEAYRREGAVPSNLRYGYARRPEGWTG
jgi:hypothetical protein